MPLGDMLDILHYYMEEDFVHVSEEEAYRQSAVRESIYKNLYDYEYPYPIKQNQASNTAIYNPENDIEDSEYIEDIPQPFNPKKQPTKSYVPPTELNPDAAKPFGSILDAPLK